MTLTTAEKSAVRAYSGTLYNEINESLRSDSPMKENARAAMNHLDAAISKSVLSDDLIVYRGVDDDYASELERRELREGLVISDRGFLSTSKRKKVAEGFLGDTGGGMLLKIRLAAGSNALDARPYSESPGEDEIILGRDVDLRVLGYDAEEDVLELELI